MQPPPIAAARQWNAELESELAALRGELSAEMAKPKETQRGLIQALRPEIDKCHITVDLNNERLMINPATGSENGEHPTGDCQLTVLIPRIALFDRPKHRFFEFL